MTNEQLADKVLAVSQRAATYINSKDKLHEAVLAMGPGCLFDDMSNDDQRLGAYMVLDWLDAYLTPRGTGQ